MPFCGPKDLVIGESYKLTEFISGIEVGKDKYFLISLEPDPNYPDSIYPIPGFSRVIDAREPAVFLKQAYPQFGDPTWRHAHKCLRGFSIYEGPIGRRTWNQSWVEVEKITI